MALYKIEFQLEQQTPMLHFQSNAGRSEPVGIRGTDVLPRIKKHLLYAIERPQEYSLTQDETGFLVSINKSLISKNQGGEGAAPFRLSITFNKSVSNPNGTSYNIQDKRDKPYFGDIDDTSSNAITSMIMTPQTTIVVTSFSRVMTGILNKVIPAMFLLENFGTRSNKGYGSFIVKNIDAPKMIQEKVTMSHCIEFNYSGSDDQKFEKIFSTIHTFYTIAKSGINHNGYFKSLLWRYIHKDKEETNQAGQQDIKRILWEKRFFKLQISRRPINEIPYFFRIWLGYSPVFTFRRKAGKVRMDFDYGCKSPEDDIEFRTEVKKELKCTEPKFARSMSPLYFKPVIEKDSNGKSVVKIYIILKPEVYVDKLNGLSVHDLRFRCAPFDKDIAPYPDFQLTGFLDYCFRRINQESDLKSRINSNAFYKSRVLS